MPISKNLPKDASRNTIPLMPAAAALKETYDATISTATEIALSAATTLIEVTTVSQAVFMKWTIASGTAVSTTDYDHLLPANSITAWEVPVNLTLTTGARYTAVSFIEEAATARLSVCEF
jgi:hypothetical protein